jgi:CRP/FNR family transcriptional regulator, anaerobic regulatory protein
MSRWTNPERFALYRPALTPSLLRGDAKLGQLVTEAPQTLLAGTQVLKAGMEHDYVYRLQSGWACRSRRAGNSRDQLLHIFLPGDLFAMKSLFMTLQPDNIWAISDATVERWHYAALQSASDRDADVAHRCTWQLMEEDRRMHSWLFALAQGSAEERFALLLVDLRRRLALAECIPEDALAFDLPLTQVQIANHLGITPVHMNRVVRSFKSKRIAQLTDTQVRIEDLPELLKLAAPLLDGHSG